MINTPKLPLRSHGNGYEVLDADGKSYAELLYSHSPEELCIVWNYYARLRDQLQAIVRSATEQELDNAMQLLAELAKEVKP